MYREFDPLPFMAEINVQGSEEGALVPPHLPPPLERERRDSHIFYSSKHYSFLTRKNCGGHH